MTSNEQADSQCYLVSLVSQALAHQLEGTSRPCPGFAELLLMDACAYVHAYMVDGGLGGMGPNSF